MSEYLLKWKDKYRCMAEIDESTGEFTRHYNGQYEYDSIYITCNNEDQIYDVNSRKSILQAYITSVNRGHRIIKEIYQKYIANDFSERFEKVSDKGNPRVDWDNFVSHVNSLNNDIMFDIQDLSCEVLFNFNGNKHIDIIAELLKAKKPMSNTSPFNVKYLPKHKEKLALRKAENDKYKKYDMPKGYWDEMKNIILPTLAKRYKCKIDKVLDDCYKDYGKHIHKNLVKEAESNNLKVNHYIHSIGEWDNFIEYLKLKL